jgi:hypothetical protein
MRNRKFISVIGIIVIILGVLIVLGALKRMAPQNNQPEPVQDQTANWTTYTNDTYGFQLKYPKDWQVVENKDLELINIFKKAETAKPPFTFHNNVTAIAILPQGLGTEGPLGELHTDTVSFAGTSTVAIQYLLKDGSVWGQFIPTDDLTSNPKWASFAFIWAGNKVENLKVACVEDGREVADNKCELGLDSTGQIERTGSINADDKRTLDLILGSFKFTK